MFPRLIDLGTHKLPLLGKVDLFLPTYGVLFALGVVAAWFWFMRRARSLGLPEDRLFNLSFYSLLAGILGAKVLLVLVEWRDYVADPALLLGTIRSAGVLMGGVVAGAVTFILYCRKHGLPLWRLGDAIAAPLALAQAVGRLGCFSAGCCFGVPVSASFPFGVTFTSEAAHRQTGVTLGVPLFPTQLTEMVYDLVLVAVLTLMWRRGVRPPGTTVWTYVLLYSLGRGIIEFWRGDTVRGVYFGGAVSTSQLIAAGAIVLSVAMLIRGWRKRGRSGESES